MSISNSVKQILYPKVVVVSVNVSENKESSGWENNYTTLYQNIKQYI